MNKYKKLALLPLLLLSLPVLLLATNPGTLPLPLLVLPFMLIFACIFVVAVMIANRINPNTGRRRVLINALLIAGGPVLLLVFQSLHQLSLRDVLITAALLAGCGFYISRIDFDGR
jgi:low temperature requirement protein LtrA